MRYTLGVQESIKNIFAAVVVGLIDRNRSDINIKQEVYRGCLPRFLTVFNDNIFQDEYALLHNIIKTLKVKVFSAKQLEEIIDRNRDEILKSDKINLNRWGTSIDGKPVTDDEKLEAFRIEVLQLADELSNRIVTEDEYISSSEIFIKYYVEQSMIETVQNMAVIMSDSGLSVRKKGRSVLYKGVEDCKKYYSEQLEIIENLEESDGNSDTIIDEQWLSDEYKEEEKDERDDDILDFGLTEIDSTIGYLRRSNILSILGPPKGGKTRFTNYLVNRALESGLNVCVWAIDGTKEEWIATQTAAIMRKKYGISYDSKKILERRYDSPEIKEMVLACKTSIATDFSRGRLSFISGTAYSETFIERLKAHYNKYNAFDILVIDQLINIQSKYGKPKVDRISSAYIDLKDLISQKLKRKVLALVPAQLKQAVIDELRKGNLDTMDVTVAGESSEVIRSADEVIGLFSNKEERMSNRINFYSVASRHSEDFGDFVARAELGCCYFESDASLNV